MEKNIRQEFIDYFDDIEYFASSTKDTLKLYDDDFKHLDEVLILVSLKCIYKKICNTLDTYKNYLKED